MKWGHQLHTLGTIFLIIGIICAIATVITLLLGGITLDTLIIRGGICVLLIVTGTTCLSLDDFVDKVVKKYLPEKKEDKVAPKVTPTITQTPATPKVDVYYTPQTDVESSFDTIKAIRDNAYSDYQKRI